MNADGSGVTRLTDKGVHQAVWSPDGSHIAFARYNSEQARRCPNSDIHVMNADGSGQTRLTQGYYAVKPSWSLDATRIAFVIVGRPCGDAYSFERSIHVVNVENREVTSLSSRIKDTDDFPVWSPEGSWIAFSSSRQWSEDLYVISPNRSNLVRLTELEGSPYLPVWSPDGNGIAFKSFGEG